jgi:hypothetical protein
MILKKKKEIGKLTPSDFKTKVPIMVQYTVYNCHKDKQIKGEEEKLKIVPHEEQSPNIDAHT